MKKLIFAVIIACLAVSAVSAQGWDNNWGQAPQEISVTGTLQLQNGVIAVVSGNNAYFVPVLIQYVGFIEDLREGAQISVNGFALGNYIQPTRVILNGRTYDFTANASQNFAYGGWGNPGGSWGYHGGGWGHHGGSRGGWGHHGGGWGRGRGW